MKKRGRRTQSPLGKKKSFNILISPEQEEKILSMGLTVQRVVRQALTLVLSDDADEPTARRVAEASSIKIKEEPTKVAASTSSMVAREDSIIETRLVCDWCNRNNNGFPMGKCAECARRAAELSS